MWRSGSKSIRFTFERSSNADVGWDPLAGARAPVWRSSGGKKVVCVLEVGCGTGMLTQHLVDVLPEFPSVVVEHVATDISLGLAMQAVQRFSHPYMRAAAYDLTHTLEEQGIAPASFDVVSVLHVLHAMADLSKTMKSISELLMPGRYVITVNFDGEAWQMGVPGMLWYDFIFGSFQEWCVVVVHRLCGRAPRLICSLCCDRFDYREDCSAHCTISLEHWQRLLCGSGFNCMTFSSSHPQEDHSLVFLAQKAGTDHHVLPPTVKRLASPRHPHSNGNAKTCYALEIFASKDLSHLHLHKELLVHVSAPLFSYSWGREMRLQDQLMALDVAEALSIWIMATNGPDGDVARGLCRMLAKELLAWKIHLVICEACGSGEPGCTKGAREGCAVAWEAWRGPGRAKGGQDACVMRW